VLRDRRLKGHAAVETAWRAIRPAIATERVGSLFWDRNYFKEPEYWDSQMIYEELVARLAPLKPGCAAGEQINHWWRSMTPTLGS
jgi:hypothetical protein